MNPNTEQWLLSTISKRLQRIAEGREPMSEDRALTLLSILKDTTGDIPSLTELPQAVKEWLEAAIESRLAAMAAGTEVAEESRMATLVEALAALRPPAEPGTSVNRVDTGAGLSGGPIVSTGTISLSTSSQQAIARANTAVQPEDLADVATSGNYADLTNTPAIPEQFNPVQGANMLITGAYPNITFSAVAGEEFTPVWGEIQGTLSDQTDLQNALDGKAPAVHQHNASDINAGTLANARISQGSVTQHQAALSIGWSQLSGLPAFATRWPTWNEVTGKPSVPTSADYVATSGTQTGLSGDKTWTGSHTFTSSSNTDSLTVERTGGTPRNAYVTYSTNATTIYAGIANVNDTTWGIGTNVNLTSNNTPFQFDVSTGAFSATGSISDSVGNLRTAIDGKANASRTITAGNGLSGGGTLAANRTITLGTPGTLSGSTTNAVQTNSHTHALAPSVFTGQSNLGAEDLNGRSEVSGYATVSTAANATVENNYPWNGGGGSLLNFTTETSSSYRTQIFNNRNGSRIAFRARSGTTWTPWREFWHTGNFDPSSKQDVIGYTPANAAHSITAGNGLSGGGTLGASRTVTLGTPGTLSGSTTNAVTTTSHTHALSANLTAWDGVTVASKADSARTLTAGNGLTGGGNLTANRTITLATPGTITATSTNSVSASSHTHNLDTTGNFTWNGNHIFVGDMIARSSSASSQMTVERTGNTINAAAAYTTTGGTVYAGQGDSGYFNWGTNTDLRYSNAGCWGRIGADGLEVKGTVASSNAMIRGTSAAALFSFEGTTTGSTIYFRPRGTSTSTNQTIIDWNGNMTVGGTVTATNLTATSDPKLKKDIKPVKARRELIEKLEYFSFKWKYQDREARGIMADRVRELAPDMVYESDDGMLSVDKSGLALEMVFALIDMLKENEGDGNGFN